MRRQFTNNSHGVRQYGRILALMAGVGIYALLAQILLLREFLVVFSGNELTIGVMFAGWLALVGAGSYMAKFSVARLPAERLRIILLILLTLAASILPLQVVLVRVIRTILNVAYGEYAPFVPMLAGLAAILAPGCLIIGFVFPCVCRLTARDSPFAVSRVYAAESLGSLAAGIIFSFWLVMVMRPLSVAALAGVFVLLGAALLARARVARGLLGLLALVFALAAFYPPFLASWERASIVARWRSFGVLPLPDSPFSSAARLLAACDSRYQNLAIIETEGQKTLYASGQVAAVFPDAVAGEHKIHFIMAQKPDARRVLLVGGNPVNDIPELLKYPLQQLVYVELDEKIGSLIEPFATGAYAQSLRDPRLAQVHADAPRYVKQYGREGAKAHRDVPFDAILVDASEPATLALNRFYTEEFYRDIRRIMAPDGFLYTAVDASEDLQGETAFLTASIGAALRMVFERVLVTAGTQNKFFAGSTNSPITLARTTLFERSAGAKLATLFFRPDYFLGADEISPEKIDFIEGRLAAIPVAANTVLKPVSTFYQIALWSRFSGSGLESLLGRFVRLRLGWVAAGALGFGLLALGIGALFGRRSAGANAHTFGADPSRRDGARAASVFSRSMLALVIAASGLCGMALELILIFMFQSLLGYVYSKVGLIVAMFMLGLTMGALGASRIISGGARRQWRVMAAAEIILILEAACIPWLMNALSAGLMNWIPWGWVEALIYGAIAASGILVGAQFALANELMDSIHGGAGSAAADGPGVHKREAGPMPEDSQKLRGGSAALLDAVDHAGAAVGGAVVGILLLPLFGVAAACFLLAAIKAASLLCLLAARQAVGLAKPRADSL